MQTRILRLEMKGFKSFANKTEILFGDKYNCVLGPNGSGKSNILDALVFVLGKSGAKGLRAEKTANLIYNGGKTKQPAKEAEVSIVFDNASGIFGDLGKELVITRVIKEKGDGAGSDYLLNGKKKTRQEILDTLEKARINPDGHNIILQGDIIHLIEMSGIERRQLIEEIAGIGVYEEKKQKALNELERVDQRLNDTQIILTEREAYLRELKSERDQAMKFKKLQDDLKRNKKTLLVKRQQAGTKEKDRFETAIKKHDEAITKATGQIEDIKAKINEHKAEIDSINKEIERKGEKEQVALHKEVEALRVDLGIKTSRIQTLAQELEKVKERRERLLKDNEELFGKIKYIEEERVQVQKEQKAAEQELAQVRDRIAAFKKKHAMEDTGRLDEQMHALDGKAEKLQEHLAQLRQKQQEAMREKDRTDIHIEQADERIAKVLDAEKANKKQLADLKAKQDAFKQATKELQQALAEDASLAGQISTARGKVSTLTEDVTKLRAEHTSVRESGVGGLVIEKVLEQKKTIKGIIGTVAELGSVNKEHQLAVEIAAGNRISAIVTEDEKTAADCIEYLRKSQYGVASFLPLNKLKAPDKDKALADLGKTKGVVGLAMDLVEYDKKYDIVFRYVLGNTLVVDSLDTARRIGIGKFRMVTLDGDLIETSGAMQGGFRAKKRAGMGFVQKELGEKLARIEAELADQEAILARLEQKRRDIEKIIDRLREHKATLEAEVITLEKSLHIDSKDLDMNKGEKARLQQESKRFEKELDDAIAEISKANKELANIKIEKQKVRDQISQLRSPEVLAQLTSFEEKEDEVQRHINELSVKLKSGDAQLLSVLGPEAERIKGILKQHDKEHAGFTKEQADLKEDLKRLEKDLAEKDALEKKFLSQFKGLFAKRDEAAKAITALEKQADIHALDMRDHDSKKVGISLELARVKAELAGMEEEASQYAGVEPFTDKSDDDCRLEIKQFERMLSDIGAVNMKALEIYDSVEREYTELVSKKERLVTERQDVLLMINEIDSKKSDIFMKTFEVLNKNFQRIFLSLSAKGEAYLDIENEKDIFSGGVMIKVRLTGKKFMDIRSLSGGEKTMTALAFLFAVQEHEPAHFYILDEVDAALDKHNSEKLAKLVRAYCKNAQYVVISHNDAVISEADNLYGVSMNEHGITKVTTLEI